MQGDLPPRRKSEGRSHIQKVISVQDSDDPNQLQQTNQMISGDRIIERQTPESSNMEAANGTVKT